MKKSKYSILFIGSQMAVGGAQKVLLDQANWFHIHGYKVAVLFFYDKENLYERWQKRVDFPIHVLRMYKQNTGKIEITPDLFGILWSLWRLLRSEKFDVVEAFTHDSNILALPLAKLAGVKVRIATHHGVIENFPRWREKLHTWLINHGIAHSLVAVSSRIQQQAILEGIHADRITVIKNGIVPLSLEGINRPEFRNEAGLKDNDLFLVSIGRLVYQKAHEVLIQAMPFILKEYPNVRLGICGDGVLRSQLESQILKLDISDSVKLLGKKDNVTGFLAVADIFVLPSRWEGMPIALLEAMSAGLPVVATEVEGVDEVVKDGQHGFLVPVEDMNELANAILQLLKNIELRLRMGAAAKTHILEYYTENIMCERYSQIMMKYLHPDKG